MGNNDSHILNTWCTQLLTHNNHIWSAGLTWMHAKKLSGYYLIYQQWSKQTRREIHLLNITAINTVQWLGMQYNKLSDKFTRAQIETEDESSHNQDYKIELQGKPITTPIAQTRATFERFATINNLFSE